MCVWVGAGGGGLARPQPGEMLPCSVSLVSVATRGRRAGEESAQGSWDSFFLGEVPCSCYKIDLYPGVACSALRGRSLQRGPPWVCVPLAGCCSVYVLSNDTTSSSWSHHEPPLSLSCVLEEVNSELALEQERVLLLSWVCLEPGFKPQHPDCRAYTLTLGPGARAQWPTVRAFWLFCGLVSPCAGP